MTIEIIKPLENIKIKGKHTRAVGIPEWRLQGETDPVVINIQYLYKTGGLAKGQRQFPHKFKISKKDIMDCTHGDVGGRQGFIVPIEKMTELQTFTHHHNVMTAICRYCKQPFEYYLREDPHINCLKDSCIQKAKADGIYKDFLNKPKPNNDATELTKGVESK